MSKPFARTQRIAGTMHREIARLLREEFKDPRVGMITVLEVNVSRDLSHAQVFISVMETDKAETTMTVLNQAAGFFRSHISKMLSMRITPQIKFIYDDSLLKGNHIEDVLKGL